MPQIGTGKNVYEAAVERAQSLYENGHRVVVSFSGGKDSGVALEICVEAARRAGRLPVEAIIRDDEIMLPGTYEYAERVAARDDVDLTWVYACQPSVNIFNRDLPYWWVFDPLLEPGQWIRKPPEFAEFRPGTRLTRMVREREYPSDAGKETFCVLGIRAEESPRRRMSVYSAGGFLTKPTRDHVRKARILYDWKGSDVWFAIKHFGWDYNKAYDVYTRLGVPAVRQRIATPTLNASSLEALQVAEKAWPKWFQRVAERLPGVRTAVQFGASAVVPIRVLGETWEETFWRTCVREAPAWIAERAETAAKRIVKTHAAHSSAPFPQKVGCRSCSPNGSWQRLTQVLYCGDPLNQSGLCREGVHPAVFRPGDEGWVDGDE